MNQVLQQWWALASALPHKVLGLSAWLVVMGLVFGALERWGPIREQRFVRKDFAQDVGYYFLGGLLPPFFIVLLVTLIAGLVNGRLPASYYAGVAGLPLWLRVALMVIVGDMAFYWAHRWAHELEWLWRLHSIHHSPTALDWLVNTRAHPLDLVFARTVSTVPIILLGLRQPAVDTEAAIAVYLTLTTFWAFFVHSNVRWRLGWLEQIIVTPAFHHWHHAHETRATLNKNYAAIFPWIDRLFGTYHLPANDLPASYGAARRLPATLSRQLLSPFLDGAAASAGAGVSPGQSAER